MEQVTLTARARPETGTRPSRRLRRQGLVPAIVYGSDLDPLPVAVDGSDLHTALHTESGLNAVINVDVEDDDTVLTVAREIQRDPVKGWITHLDFIQVSLDVAIEAEVGIEFEGTPVAVREEDAIVETIAATVVVEALPTAVPSSIAIDISELELGQTIRVEDLPTLDGVTYVDEPDRPLLTVLVPRMEEEEPAEEVEELEPGEEPEEGDDTTGDDDTGEGDER